MHRSLHLAPAFSHGAVRLRGSANDLHPSSVPLPQLPERTTTRRRSNAEVLA